MKATERTAAALALAMVLILFAGCSGSSSNKAGGKQADKPVVLTLADYESSADEISRFTDGVTRLSHGAMHIEVENGWRRGQVGFENGLIRDVRTGKADLGVVGSRAWDSVGVPWISMVSIGMRS